MTQEFEDNVTKLALRLMYQIHDLSHGESEYETGLIIAATQLLDEAVAFTEGFDMDGESMDIDDDTLSLFDEDDDELDSDWDIFGEGSWLVDDEYDDDDELDDFNPFGLDDTVRVS